MRIYHIILLIVVNIFSNYTYSISKLDVLMEKLNSKEILDSTRADLLFQVSKEYFREENFVSSLSYSDKAENLYKELNKENKIADVRLFKSGIFIEVSDYENAVNNIKRAQDYYAENSDTANYEKANVRLASVNARLGYLDKSKKMINDAYNFFNDKDDLEVKEEIYYQYAIIYGMLNNLDSALYFLQKTQKLLKLQNEIDYSELGGVYNNIGAIYSKKDDFEKSLSSYRKALEVFEKNENLKGVGVSYSNVAFLYHKFQKLDSAQIYYEKSEDILLEHGDLIYLSTIYGNWSDLYKEIGDYKNAYDMNIKYMEIDDSISGEEVMTRVAELEKQYELKKKNQELEFLEKENEVKRNRQYLLISIIVLIIVVAFLIYRNLKVSIKNSRLKAQILDNEKKELREELDYKGKEIEDLALRIIEKNKFLEGLKQEVSEIDGVGENKDKIKTVSSHIRDNLYIDQDRKEFELQLDEIHKSFLFKLDKKYPNLTKSERRLATLLVMDMSTKDIATIQNLSISGVKTARYRLRKKINLDSKIDLSTHFKSI